MAALADPPQRVDPSIELKSKYRPEIDGLRAFAVLAVILNHFHKDLLPSGYLGVDIFFVISGYVITSSLSGKESKKLAEFLSGFYARRIKRLAPALVVFVLVTSLLICLFNPDPETALQTGRASLFGWSNLYLLDKATDYFAPSTELNPFTHTWSLGVEEQFYVLFPFLIWFSGFGKRAKHGARNLCLAMAPLGAASLIGFISFYQTNQPAAYFSMPTRFWEMAAGCLIFIGFQQREKIEQALQRVPPLWVVAGMVTVLFSPIQWAVPATIAIVVLTSILIACLKDGTAAFVIFTNRRVVVVGLISYSLYLWHWGILSLSRWSIGIHWWSVPLQLALMFSLSFLSYRWIEQPARTASPSQAKGVAILSGFLALIGSWLLVAALGQGAEQKLLFAGTKTRTHGAANGDGRDGWRLANTHLNPQMCHADEEFSDSQIRDLFDHCLYPKAPLPGQRTVAFVGDSHALSLLPAEQLIINKGGRIVHYSHDGCPFPRPPYGILPEVCDRFLVKAEANLIERLKRGDLVVILNYHSSHLGDMNMIDSRHNMIDAAGTRPADELTKLSLYLEAVKKFAAKANQQGVNIILVGAGCRSSEVAMLQKEWFRPFPSADTVATEVVHARRVNETLRAGLATISNLSFLEPDAILSVCADPTQYLKLYRDTDHLSLAGASLMMREILAAVGPLSLERTLPTAPEQSQSKSAPEGGAGNGTGKLDPIR